jgi:hypothetical protein
METNAPVPFKYEIKADAIGNSLFINSSINDTGFKLDYDYQISQKQKFDFGLQLVHHVFSPSIFSDLTDSIEKTFIKNIKIPNEEFGLYASLNQEMGSGFAFNIGLRLSGLIAASKTYVQPEPRFTFRKTLTENQSIKGGYSRNSQYVHLIQSSSVSLPTDLWYPITKNIPPGMSDQVSLGYFTNIGPKRDIIVSVEGYYKWMKNLIEYKEGSILLFQKNIEDQLLVGNGRAYGGEIMIQKNFGLLSGWIGYTFSVAKRQFEDINRGKEFFAKYDRRHDLSVVASIALSKKIDFNVVYVYSTGNPFTPIISRYIMPTPGLNGVDLIPVYADRNSYRLNNSKRIDFDLVIKSSGKSKFEFHIGAYNVLNDLQPSRVTVDLNKEGKLIYREKGLLGLIASVGIKYKFRA